MLILLPQDKIKRIVAKTKAVLDKDGCTVGDMRLLLGSLESLRLATTLAPLHYRGRQYLQAKPGR